MQLDIGCTDVRVRVFMLTLQRICLFFIDNTLGLVRIRLISIKKDTVYKGRLVLGV